MEEAEIVPAIEQGETTNEQGETNQEAPADEILSEESFVVTRSDNESPDAKMKAVIEAVIYITDEPLTAAQIAAAFEQPPERITRILEELSAEYSKAEHGLTIREVAGGYKMSTKPEHHESIRAFVRKLKPALKLSLPALETLAVIAYKQPITTPEIMEIRGVQGAGVLKTLLDRKLIAASGRKQVIGKPILYKTTREFLVQFGLKDLSELPTLKEFEELGRLALADSEIEEPALEQSLVDHAPAPTDAPATEPTEDPEPSKGEV